MVATTRASNWPGSRPTSFADHTTKITIPIANTSHAASLGWVLIQDFIDSMALS